MQVSIPLKSVPGGLIEPTAGETEDHATPEGSEAGVRSHSNTSKRLPIASMRLVVLPVGSNEKGPDLRPQLGIGFSEWLLEWCDAIDLRTAIETESEG
jgi:hypothetical protein